MTDDAQVDAQVIDAAGSHAAGRGLRRLAEEHAQYRTQMGGHLDGESPVPHEEVAGPYFECLSAFMETWDEVTAQLGFTGAGQMVMADNDVTAETANVTGIAHVMEA
ncbi:hypothetical protein Misp01_11780 [Microtetraspora sp. NBRC 13810]|uniref:hypothetical protein n=1 Tax=Microtetraspora sp. NBRC 13810 TaxID=3030990 RepID=UPI0024A17232|nr:hypothetical protein [Microtetraspora sp. NBRC 13810]GLW06048.1 hypothetical protein Misp01_11780 [Microtetraspora sp. NBRC 13810]